MRDPQRAQFDDEQFGIMLELFRERYRDRPGGWLDSDIGRTAALGEVEERQYWFRLRYLPWLEGALTLAGAHVLEIGSGNGSSAVPLAMAGAIVDALDIDPRGHPMASMRAELMGVSDRLRLHTADAISIGEMFDAGQFSVICFSAALEHMTFGERLAATRAAWDLLPEGGALVIMDTPNRLWYFDDHTSDLPFFHWLPDDIALAFSTNSPRADFAADLVETDPGALTGQWGPDVPPVEVRLSRWGRGVSYHDLSLALARDVTAMEVDGEWEFRRRNDAGFAQWWAESVGGRYQSVLREIAPEVPVEFLEPELAVCITKA